MYSEFWNIIKIPALNYFELMKGKINTLCISVAPQEGTATEYPSNVLAYSLLIIICCVKVSTNWEHHLTNDRRGLVIKLG
jgi:hypothetical protein